MYLKKIQKQIFMVKIGTFIDACVRKKYLYAFGILKNAVILHRVTRRISLFVSGDTVNPSLRSPCRLVFRFPAESRPDNEQPNAPPQTYKYALGRFIILNKDDLSLTDKLRYYKEKGFSDF
jgi:hypothetical protein